MAMLNGLGIFKPTNILTRGERADIKMIEEKRISSKSLIKKSNQSPKMKAVIKITVL